MPDQPYITQLRVRYAETDRMGTFYNARALEWFEVARTEALRQIGLPYRDLEAEGVQLPVAEAHMKFLGRAAYDDLLTLRTGVSRPGRARLRFDVSIAHDRDAAPVVEGYTVHAFADATAGGTPMRPPRWLEKALRDAGVD